MRVILRDKVVEALDVYIKQEFSNLTGTVPDSLSVCITYYDHFVSRFRELKIGYFQVGGDSSVFKEVMKTYEERILLKLFADGFCGFNYLGKYWKSCIE